MSFYGRKVEEKIRQHNFSNNILEQYDNVTYNVRFYMIDQQYQEEVFNERKRHKSAKIKDEYKIIIFETGVSTNYNLEDLVIKTFYNQKSSGVNCITTEISMKIKELNDCSLTNKLAVVSNILGYDSYHGNPYHLDIWFSGYDHITKQPIRCINNDVYTFDVIISECKSHLDYTGTTYNFKLNPFYMIPLNKEINVITNKGILVTYVGTMKEMKDLLQNAINDNYFDMRPELKQYYNNDILTITLKDFSNIDIKDIVNYNGKLITKSRNSDNEYYLTNFDENVSPKTSETSSETVINPDKSITLDNFFQELCFISSDYKDCVAIPTYTAIPFKNVNKEQLYKIHMNVVILREPYLKWWNNFRKNGGSTFKYESMLESIEDMQVEAIDQMRIENTLQKKYEFYFSGKDTNVLELNTKVDNLWFLNLGQKNIEDSQTSNIHTNKIFGENSSENINSENIAEIVYRDYDKIRKLSADRRLYVDDIYNTLNKKELENLLTTRRILIKNQVFSQQDAKSFIESDNEKMTDYQVAKVGYTNLFMSGNMIEMKFTILGDPYWINIPSDNTLYSDSIFPEHSLLYYFYFTMRTGLKSEGQGWKGGHDTIGCKDFSGLYQIIQSTSTFRDGKFTQQLHGVIDTKFIQSTLLKA